MFVAHDLRQREQHPVVLVSNENHWAISLEAPATMMADARIGVSL